MPLRSQPEVQVLLEELKRGGTVDSSGQFTLRLEQALPRLARYRLPGGHLYPLKLAQAAVASGARRVRAAVDAFGVVLEHDGEPIERQELSELFGYLLDSRPLPELRALRHLAAGIHAATATGARRIELSTAAGLTGLWDADGSFRFAPVVSGFPLRGGRKGGLYGQAAEWTTRFELLWKLEQVAAGWLRQARAGLAWLWSARSCAFLEEEARVLEERGAFCPVPVELNGRLLPRWREPAGCLAAEYVVGGALRAPASSAVPRPPRVPRELLGARSIPCRAVLWLTKSGDPARLSFVEDGWVIEVQHLDLGVPGLVGVVDAGSLKTDLSGLGVVQDSAYGRLLEDLRGRARELLERAQGQ